MIDSLYAAALIGAMSLGTILLRFLPFAIFSGKRKVPPVVLYLGEVLPGAALGMLVIYCLKDLSFGAASSWLPELLASGAVAFLQLLRRNTILSIVAGTLFYMLLLQLF